MRAGSIPIFVGDGYPLPLDAADGTSLIPWSRISLRVDGRWVEVDGGGCRVGVGCVYGGMHGWVKGEGGSWRFCWCWMRVYIVW